MATKTRARAPQSDPSQASLFTFDVGNEPNADILLNSLRSAGYTLEHVVADLVDNTIDAGATVGTGTTGGGVPAEAWTSTRSTR